MSIKTNTLERTTMNNPDGKKNVRILVILQTESEVYDALNVCSKQNGDYIFFAISPHAEYILQKEGINHKTACDYPGGDERLRLGFENFGRLDKITEILDIELIRIHQTRTLKPANYAFFYLKTLFDVLSSTIHLIKTIIAVERPHKIFVYSQSSEPQFVPPYSFGEYENIFAKVLQIPGWKIPVIVKKRPQRGIQNTKSDKAKKLLGWESIIYPVAKNNSFVFNLGLLWKRFGLKGISLAITSLLSTGIKSPIVIYESGYNWDDALPELYHKNLIPVYRLTDADIEKYLQPNDFDHTQEIMKFCADSPELRKIAVWDDIDASAILFHRLSTIVGYSLRRSGIAYKVMKNLIRKKHIKALLFSIHTVACTNAVVQAAHDSGISVFSWQHGGGGFYYHPMMPYGEYIASDYHLVFGKGVVQSYQNTVLKLGLLSEQKFIPVGSSSIDLIQIPEKLRTPQDKRKILYITTNYYGNFYYISSPAVPLAYDMSLWFVQMQIINCAKNHPSQEFIIKLHPTHRDGEPLKSYIRDLEIKNIGLISREATISELIEEADLIIFDIVSTSILQVLKTDIPVIVYHGTAPIDKEPLALLKRRACVYENSTDFIAAIDRYLEKSQSTSGDFEAKIDLSDKSFIEFYGTYINDGKSARRAADFVYDILSKNSLNVKEERVQITEIPLYDSYAESKK
jgi:hypothetical protein